MSVHIEDVLAYAIAQDHDRYVFGAEANPTNPDPSVFDCSELVEWSCARAKVTPRMPDGAVNQYGACRNAGTIITVDAARKVRGALLFSGPGFGGGRTGRTAIHHVGFSLGDDRTIEARGTKWGVGSWTIGHPARFTFAARIPGVEYGARTPLPATPEAYVPIGKDQNTDLGGLVDALAHLHLGHGFDPADAEQVRYRNELKVLGATAGLEALNNALGDTPEARARRPRLRALVEHADELLK